MSGILDGDRQFHIQTTQDEISRYVILAGDPGRIPKIAGYFDDARQISFNREYNVYTGTLDGVKVSACSTGIGGPSSAIAVEELIKCGADTFIRVGTAGGIADKVRGGDLVVASAAICAEGTSREYLPSGYPATADFDVTYYLGHAARELSEDRDGCRCHVGIVHSKDSFYGQVAPETSPVFYTLKNRWESYKRLGCLCSEMECAAIYSVGLTRGVRCGAVLLAIWNMERTYSGEDDTKTLDTDRAIRCAVSAVRKLISADRESEKK
ncbi:uridine phosphorylase [Ruminococcaceae bacterium FB2012]|nr:uridine phosphorylase [Ruminococcaceae bacterium FB2012]